MQIVSIYKSRCLTGDNIVGISGPISHDHLPLGIAVAGIRLRLSQMAGADHGVPKLPHAHPIRQLLPQELSAASQIQGTETRSEQQHKYAKQQLRAEPEPQQQRSLQNQCATCGKRTDKKALNRRVDTFVYVLSGDHIVSCV